MNDQWKEWTIDCLAKLKESKGSTVATIYKFMKANYGDSMGKNDTTNKKNINDVLDSLLSENRVSKLKGGRYRLESSLESKKRKELLGSTEDASELKKQKKEEIDEDLLPNNSFGNLPRDIAELIFSQLNYIERASLCKVSQGVRKLARTKRLWEVLDFSKMKYSERAVLELISIWHNTVTKIIIEKETNEIGLQKIFEVLTKNPCRNLIHLNLSGTKISGDGEKVAVESLLPVFQEFSKNIRYFRIYPFINSGFDGADVSKILSKWKDLRHLSISESNLTKLTEGFDKTWPHLESLELIKDKGHRASPIHQRLLESIARISNLKNLMIYGYETSDVWKDFKNLNKLEIKSFKFGGDSIKKILENSPKMTQLSCNSNGMIAFETDSLQSLRLSTSTNNISISSISLEKILLRDHLQSSFGKAKIDIKCPNAHLLMLYHFEMEVDALLLTSCYSLKKLFLHDCQISNLKAALKHFPNLEILNLSKSVFRFTELDEIGECKALKELYIENNRLLQTIDLIKIESDGLEYLQILFEKAKTIEVSGKNLKELRIYNLQDGFINHKATTALCPSLEILEISHVRMNPSSIENIAVWAPSLTKLITKSSSFTGPSKLFTNSSSFNVTFKLEHPTLKELYAKDSSIATDQTKMKLPNLEYLNLSELKTPRNGKFVHQYIEAPNLQILKLNEVGIQTEKLEGVKKQYPKLTALHIATSERLETDLIDTVCKLFGENLTSCCFGPALTDDNLVTIAKHCKKLEKIEIRNSGITDVGLRTLVPSLNNLKLLKLVKCGKITASYVAKLRKERIKVKKDVRKVGIFSYKFYQRRQVMDAGESWARELFPEFSFDLARF